MQVKLSQGEDPVNEGCFASGRVSLTLAVPAHGPVLRDTGEWMQSIPRGWELRVPWSPPGGWRSPSCTSQPCPGRSLATSDSECGSVSSSGCGSHHPLAGVGERIRPQMSLFQFQNLSACPAFLRKWGYSFVTAHLKMQTKPFIDLCVLAELL